MRSSIAVFISFYHDELMRFHLNFYRLQPSTFSTFGIACQYWKSFRFTFKTF